MTERQLISLRVSPDLHERIKRAATGDRRSMNNYLEALLDTAVPSDGQLTLEVEREAS